MSIWSWFNPGSWPGDVAHEIGNAIVSGLEHFAEWAAAGMVSALTSTTQVDLSGWFQGPWRGMVAVAALVAVPILIAGVIQAALSGEPGEIAKRGLFAPIGVVVGTAGALGLVDFALALVSYACSLVVSVSLGGSGGAAMAKAFAHLVLIGSAAGVPGVVVGVLELCIGVLAFVIWVELALRSAVVYLVVAFIPLGLAGLFWKRCAHWLKRLCEVLVAVIASQLVITVAVVLATASLSNYGSSLGNDLGQVVIGVAMLLLGTLGLPLALRLVPIATEATIIAGVGTQAVARNVSRAGRTAARLAPGGAAHSAITRFSRASAAPAGEASTRLRSVEESGIGSRRPSWHGPESHPASGRSEASRPKPPRGGGENRG